MNSVTDLLTKANDTASHEASDYAKWLSKNGSGSCKDDRREYLESNGFQRGVDRLNRELIDRLNDIHTAIYPTNFIQKVK